jgi:hypothetical protein
VPSGTEPSLALPTLDQLDAAAATSARALRMKLLQVQKLLREIYWAQDALKQQLEYESRALQVPNL